jgi:hypothetical protein
MVERYPLRAGMAAPLSPVAGLSARGQLKAHQHVLDPGFNERLRFDEEAGARVDPGGARLGGQAHALAALLAGGGDSELEHARGDGAAAQLALHGDPADFGGAPVAQHPQRPDDAPGSRLQCDEVDGFPVAAVDLLLAGDTLLAAENLLAQRQGPSQLGLVGRPVDRDLGRLHRASARSWRDRRRVAVGAGAGRRGSRRRRRAGR